MIVLNTKTKMVIEACHHYRLILLTLSFFSPPTFLGTKVTINELVIESLARHHLLSIFTCQSTNNNITIASSASITIDLNRKS